MCAPSGAKGGPNEPCNNDFPVGLRLAGGGQRHVVGRDARDSPASSPPRQTCCTGQAPQGGGAPRLARHATEVLSRRDFLAVTVLEDGTYGGAQARLHQGVVLTCLEVLVLDPALAVLLVVVARLLFK